MAYEHAMRATRKGGRPAERSGDSPETGGRLVPRLISAALLIAIGGLMYYLFPDFTQDIVFDGILRKWWYFAPWVVVGLVIKRHYGLYG